MSGSLQAWVGRAVALWERSSDELTALDAASGDGDLGYTVTAGASSVIAALDQLDRSADVTEMLRAVGAGFARGNPSSFAALCAAGLLAAAHALEGIVSPAPNDVATGLEAAAARISERGGAEPGDRTVLDAIVPSIVRLRQCMHGSIVEQLEAMILAARDGADHTMAMKPRKGRAAWVGTDGTAATPDAGAVAYLRLLEAFRDTRDL